VSGTQGSPIIIDGRGKVTFGPGSRIDIFGDFVTLRGLRFIRSSASNIQLYGTSGRVTESLFDSCGARPNDACVVVRGPSAEIDFNQCLRSLSVSVQVRGVRAGTQPTNAYLHHNQFVDIARLSGNGQEPVQVAGAGGQIAGLDIAARIENNIFYNAEGDAEAVSIKTSGNEIRWNVFKEMDAAPYVRGGMGNRVRQNLLVRARHISVVSQGNSVSENIILCPREGYAISL